MQKGLFAWRTRMKTIVFWPVCIKNNNILGVDISELTIGGVQIRETRPWTEQFKSHQNIYFWLRIFWRIIGPLNVDLISGDRRILSAVRCVWFVALICTGRIECFSPTLCFGRVRLRNPKVHTSNPTGGNLFATEKIWCQQCLPCQHWINSKWTQWFQHSFVIG